MQTKCANSIKLHYVVQSYATPIYKPDSTCFTKALTNIMSIFSFIYEKIHLVNACPQFLKQVHCMKHMHILHYTSIFNISNSKDLHSLNYYYM